MNQLYSMLYYKGFETAIMKSSKDNILHGKIENTSDLVSFHGNDIDEVKKGFMKAVDDYIETCNGLNKELMLN